jgi:hypothetical protein
MTHQGKPIRPRFRPGLAIAAAALALAAACAHLALAAQLRPSPRAAAAAAQLRTSAHQARVVSVNDTGYLHLLHASGEILSEEGEVTGTLPGIAKVRLDIGTTIRATFTIEPKGGGSISGTGRATPTTSTRYTSFSGSLKVTRGTGRYAHAHGSGKLYGKIERVHDHLTVQTREGTLDY